MNPLKIRLTNARSFDHVELDLPKGLLAILGPNGAGKTTLISAIDIALFGAEGRSLAPWYPRGTGDEPMTIELVFEHGGELYRVRRSYSPKGRGQSKCDLDWWHDVNGWEPVTLESQTATREQIEELIGLSRATFRASSYLAQGDAGAFCDASPGGRKTILGEAIGLAAWNRWLERARREKRECELQIAEATVVVERAEDELAQRDQITAERATAVERRQASEAKLQHALSRLTAAREKAAEEQRQGERRTALKTTLSLAQAAVDDLRRRVDATGREIIGLDRRLAEKDKLAMIAGHREALEQEHESLRAAIEQWRERERLREETERAEVAAAELEQEVGRMEEAATRVLAGVDKELCDRCGQMLGADAAERAAESYRAEAASYGRKASEAAAEHDRLQGELALLPAEPPDTDRLRVLYDQFRQAQQAATQLAALEEVSARRTAARQELDAMRAEIPSRETGAAAALAEFDALGPHNPAVVLEAKKEVAHLETAERDTRATLEREGQRIARYDERLERLALLEEEAAAQRARRGSLLYELELRANMERACSANGIPALILEQVAIPQVEAEASRLLDVLGGPATAVELRTLRETKQGGIADTLEIVLTTESGEATYETFSGGEKARIAFALRLALAQLLAARKGADTGLLVIDEIDGLDSGGIAALVGVLEDLQRSVPRIIVVSHQSELRDAFAQSLTLENVDGHSRILNGEAA